MEGRVSTGLAQQEGRKFGRTVGIAFLVFGGIALWRGHPLSAQVLWSLGGILILGAIVAPARLKPVERAWMAMAHAISKVTTPIVMGIVYFLVVTPIGIAIRAIKGNPLTHKPGDGGYWHTRSVGAEEEKTSMHRQF